MKPAPSSVYVLPKYKLWIADRDENGDAVDSRLISAAYEIASLMFKYRQDELGCESVTAMLIQASVNAASRAVHADHIENPSAYLFTVFTRKADRHLARSQREQPLSDDFLEDEANRQAVPNAVPTAIHNRLLCRQALDMMPADLQELCELHFMYGVSMKTIAEMKGEPRNRLAVRLSRGLRRVAEALSSQRLDKQSYKG